MNMSNIQHPCDVLGEGGVPYQEMKLGWCHLKLGGLR